MRNGAVIFAKGYGLANVAAKTPVTADTLFAIGSVSKQFTCACILLLAEDGKLSVKDPGRKVLSRPHPLVDITLLDLMNHVSGYPDYYPLDFVDRRWPRRGRAPRSSRSSPSRPLDFEPRLALLLQQHRLPAARPASPRWPAGEPFARGARAAAPQAARPASHALRAGARRARAWPRATRRSASGRRSRRCPKATGWIGAAGGLWSTPTDLLAWDLALMDGKVLSPAVVGDDEHAAAADRRAHERLRLRPVD